MEFLYIFKERCLQYNLKEAQTGRPHIKVGHITALFNSNRSSAKSD